MEASINNHTTRRSAVGAADIAYCGLFVALMFIGAKIHIMIPVGTGVTVSLQIMFALLAGFILGPRRGFISVFVYLLLGLVGVPVYAHGGGLAYLVKPTYGFLIGFATAAPLAGILIRRFPRKNIAAYLISAELAMLSYYVCGLLYFYLLSNFLIASLPAIGLRDLMVIWFLSSIGPDVLIAAAAGLLAHRLVPTFERMQ